MLGSVGVTTIGGFAASFESFCTSGVGMAKIATRPMSAGIAIGSRPRTAWRGTSSSADESSAASIRNITLAGRPALPKQPQLPASASLKPSPALALKPACTMAMSRMMQNKLSVAMAICRAQREVRMASAMKISTPMIARSDHSRNAVASTEVRSMIAVIAARMGGGSRRGLNSAAFTNAP